MSKRPKIAAELGDTVLEQATGVVEVEDEHGRVFYVLSQATLREVYDDGDFDPSDAYAAAEEVFSGPEGWDAPGMEVYDEPDGNS